MRALGIAPFWSGHTRLPGYPPASRTTGFSDSHLVYGGLPAPGSGDGPFHIYPGSPIPLDSGTGPVPGSRMVFVPDRPGSGHGKIVWEYRPKVPTKNTITTDTLRLSKNGRPIANNYRFDRATGKYSGTISDVNAGDVVKFSHVVVSVDPRGGGPAVNTITNSEISPIRVPVEGSTDGGPGRWVYQDSESGMGHLSRYYQESVTHTAVAWVYRVNGKNFDCYRVENGRKWLIDAKAAYKQFLDPSKPDGMQPWISRDFRAGADAHN